MIDDGRVFTLVFAIITTMPCIGILFHLKQVVDLSNKSLLHTENFKFMEPDQRLYLILPVGPGIDPVRGSIHPEVYVAKYNGLTWFGL